MTKRIAGGIVALASLAFAAHAFGATVQIRADGKLRGALTPRAEPYSVEGPSVSVYLVDKQNVRTADGKAVTGFEFIAWREGPKTRVTVFLLVPRDGTTNTYLPGGKAENLVRREFDSYLLDSSIEVAVSKMRELGVTPMMLRQVGE